MNCLELNVERSPKAMALSVESLRKPMTVTVSLVCDVNLPDFNNDFNNDFNI